ncbi:MAG: phosphatase PAP2 family protein [Legionella sp.]|nr:phosphatase PAP2 family protein [Legionella sp.]
MHPINRNCTLISGLLICLFASIALLVNFFFYHFKGNNYLPPGTGLIGLSLLLILAGLRLSWDKTHYLNKFAETVFVLYLVMGAIAFLTNAVQFTPFRPIDDFLVSLEQVFNINMAAIVAWTHQHQTFQKILVIIYDTLPYQMSSIPVLMAALGHFSKLREYFCLMLVSALMGFGFYYFFPTIAPASVIQGPYFSLEQYATGLKFAEIHNHLSPSTIEGGMIAMPSFHAIWAWFCLYLVRGWPLLFTLLLPVNALLVISCVLLGWHYPIDLLGSLVVILITHGIYWRLSRTDN